MVQLEDILYLKDLKHLSPKVIQINEERAMNKHFNRHYEVKESVMKLYLREVLRGIKQLMYEGSLHGVKYIFEPTFNRRERATWILIMLISIALCAMNIIQMFSKWNSSPFVNVIDSLPTPIWAVPFPTVVICPQLHIKLSFVNVSELSDIEQFYASQVCPMMNNDNARKWRNNKLSPEDNKNLHKFIIQAAPKCKELVKRCYWRAFNEKDWVVNECCDVMLRPVFTNYGLCYAFNTLPLNGMTNKTVEWQRTFDSRVQYENLSWTLDEGYPKVFPPNVTMLPFRTMASGEMNGLSVELHLNMSDHQYACDEHSVGFNLLITSPTDHIYTSTVLRLPMDRLTTIEVTPLTYRTDVELQTLKPDKRQCYFQNEKQLEYYALYTDSNCKQDLLIQAGMRECNCVLYNWPRIQPDQGICSTEVDYRCIMSVASKVEEQLIHAYYDDSEEPRHRKSTADTFPNSCYPSCNDILYSSQVFYSDLIMDYSEMDKKGELTRIDVHFYDDMFLGQHRHAQYDDYYFVGAVGGLLSLFMGFSIISVVELVWFVILRPWHRAFAEICYRYFHVRRRWT